MRFLRPVEVGDRVSCHRSLERAGETSVSVKIEPRARDRDGGDPQEVPEGMFTHVALGEDGEPRPMGEDEGGDGGRS